MKRRCTALGILFLLSSSTSIACESIQLPVKPFRHLCGIVTNEIGERIPNATLTVLKAGAEIRTLRADSDGKFEFGQIEAGSYELRVRAEGYITILSPIKIVRSTAKCTGELRVVVALVCGGEIDHIKR
jgi:hypothetical protein